MRGSRLAWIASVALVVQVLSVTTPVDATSGELVVSSDTTLTADHNGSIFVDADDVTLDCAGHRITGGDDYWVGIDITSRSGITVRDCRISGFDLAIGVFESNEVTLVSNSLTDNATGIALYQSSGSVLSENDLKTRTEGYAGFDVSLSDRNQFISNQVVGAFYGFEIWDSVGNTFKGNRVEDVDGIGFDLYMADGNTLTRNEVSGARDVGYELYMSDGNTLTHNEVSGSPDIGYFLFESSGNTVEDNWAPAGVEGPGFVVDAGVNNYFIGNAAHRNMAPGFVDVTVGSGTRGTDNSYRRNVCIDYRYLGSDPWGLCDQQGTFIDDDVNTFEVSIEWLAWEGITKGCNPPWNDLFCPDDSVTRGQMAAFLVRALGYSDDGGGDLFVDDDDSVFEGDIDRLGTAGVTKGCNPPTNDRFCPDDLVTRGQMAAFLVRALGYTDDGGGDLFVDDDSSVFESDIDKLGAAGVTAGCNPPVNDRFCPDEFVTRGQMAAFLHRALGG